MSRLSIAERQQDIPAGDMLMTRLKFYRKPLLVAHVESRVGALLGSDACQWLSKKDSQV